MTLSQLLMMPGSPWYPWLVARPFQFLTASSQHSSVSLSSHGLLRRSVLLDQGPTLLPHNYSSSYICNNPISKQHHVLNQQGLGLQHTFVCVFLDTDIFIWVCQILAAACRLLSSCGSWISLSSCDAQAQLPHSMWDLSFPTRDQTHVPYIGKWILNHWTTRESPVAYILGYKISSFG